MRIGLLILIAITVICVIIGMSAVIVGARAEAAWKARNKKYSLD